MPNVELERLAKSYGESMRYSHATDQEKRGAIVALSQYRQNDVTRLSQMKNGRSNNSFEPAVNHS